MHLLNARTHKLETFIGSQTPNYAILSHTWEQEEVTFKDLTERTTSEVQAKKGYSKIQHTCDQAWNDGLGYVWVDTCCIDKSSSAELSEAINSMFRWYQEAEICYAYLSDVTTDIGAGWAREEDPASGIVMFRCTGMNPKDECSPAEFHENFTSQSPGFSASRWFTRGWTLQELIAPPHLIFFDRDWTWIGTRDLLTEVIANITGIDQRCFGKPAYLAWCNVAKRMSWAARRSTTREEDEAYCLLGIFGINLPLLYGEGQKAFVRLQEAIIDRTSDHSIFAWEYERSVFVWEHRKPWDWTLNWTNTANQDERSTHSGTSRHGDPEHQVGVLAPSVRAFEHSNTILSYQSDSTESFGFTNAGLSINVPLVDLGMLEDDSESGPIFEKLHHFGAILNCRLQGGWIALNLCKPQRSEGVHTVFRVSGRRLRYVDASTARKAEQHPITIRTPDHSNVYFPHTWAESEILTFQIDESPQFPMDKLNLPWSRKLSIVGMFPSTLWRPFYRTVGCGGPRVHSAHFDPGLQYSTHAQTLRGGIVFHCEQQRGLLKILLNFWYRIDRVGRCQQLFTEAIRLQFWASESLEQCVCSAGQVCVHQLDAAPSFETLALNQPGAHDIDAKPNTAWPSFQPAWTSSADSEPGMPGLSERTIEDSIRLSPSDFEMKATLKKERILGKHYVVLDVTALT